MSALLYLEARHNVLYVLEFFISSSSESWEVVAVIITCYCAVSVLSTIAWQ